MEKKPDRHNFRILVMYGLFGIAVTFAATILVFWILQEIVAPIPMSIFIGLLVGLAFKLFSDAIHREQNRR
jgi:hypothetical protein